MLLSFKKYQSYLLQLSRIITKINYVAENDMLGQKMVDERIWAQPHYQKTECAKDKWILMNNKWHELKMWKKMIYINNKANKKRCAAAVI